MLLHTEVERLQTKIEDERVHRGGDGAEVAHKLSHQLGDVAHLAELLGVSKSVIAVVGSAQTGELFGMCEPVKVAAVHHAAAHLACCTVHIFSGAVRYDVSSPLERAAVHRCGEGIIHDKRHTVLMSDACKLLDVEYGTAGIADCLAENNLRIRTESLLNLLLRVVRIDERTLDAKLLERNSEQIERSAVNLIACHDMVASLADVKHSVEVGSLSAACQYCTHATLKLRNLLRHYVIGGVLQASIEITLLLEVEEHRHLLRVVILECGALDDWRLDRLTVLCLISSVYTERGST